MLVDQEQDRDLGRAVLTPMGEVGLEVPPLEERASKFWAWDALGNLFATASAIVGTPLTALGTLLATSPDEAAARAFLDAPRRGVVLHNLCHNSELSVCTALPLRRVGAPITITGGSNYATSAGLVILNSSSAVVGRCGGITPGKLLLVEGVGSPHAPISGVAMTVTTGANASRLTRPAGTFTGLAVGDTCFIGAGGTNTSPRGQYRISLTDASTYIELASVVDFGLLVNTASEAGGTAKTYDLTFYKGAYAIDATLNGFPAAGRADYYSAIGYPLKALASAVGSFVASLDGVSLNAVASAATVWEATPGDDGYTTGLGPDGWYKTANLRYYRTYRYDWDGVTPVVLPGCVYGGKFKNETATEAYFFDDLMVAGANVPSYSAAAEKGRVRGRAITFGMHCVPPGANTVRPFIYDGTTRTYGQYFDAVAGFSPANLDATFRSVTMTIAADAPMCVAGLAIAPNTGYGLCTQPMAVFGRELRAADYTRSVGYSPFTIHPNFPKNWINGPCDVMTLIRLEQESMGQLPEGLSAIHCGLEARATNPGSITSGVLPALMLCDTPVQRIPSIVVYQPQILSSLVMTSGLTTVPAGAARYISPAGVSATEADVIFRMPFNCTATAFYTQSGVGPGVGQSFTYTLRKLGADGALTAATTGISTQSADTAHSMDFSAGEYASFKVVSSAGATPTNHNATLSVTALSDVYIVNAGVCVVGKVAEAQAPYIVDVLTMLPFQGEWRGVNIDMYGYQL
jgi:hypothetical protein